VDGNILVVLIVVNPNNAAGKTTSFQVDGQRASYEPDSYNWINILLIMAFVLLILFH